MKETFGQKTRRSHKRNQRVVMFWCAFVFAFVIAGVWLFRGTLFQNDSGASSSGTNQSRHDACGTADSRQKSTDVTQAPMDHEVWQKLQDLVSQDQRVQQVIDNCEIYPEDILKMLSRNLDMLNFVLEYPEKVGQVLLKLSERLKSEKFRFFCNTINAGVTATMATAPLPSVDAGQPAYPW